jgi:aspartate/methionine/tyrosine aminotransferase
LVLGQEVATVTSAREVMSSSYMNWAKTSSRARFNLATSGLGDLSIKDLDVSLGDLELTGGGYGYGPLMELIGKRYGVAKESIVTAAGTSFANHLAMAALIKPGDEVLFEHPAYEPMLATARYFGAEIKRFSRRLENGFGLDLRELQKKVTSSTRLIVLTNLHNPSSVLIGDPTLSEVGQLARDARALVMVDEVYLETLFEHQPRTAFHLGREFVITSSLTKAYGLSGLRCGWIFAEPELATKMWRLNDLFAATPVHVGERLSVLAFQQLTGIAQRAESLLTVNRSLVNKFLDSTPQLEAVRPRFGTTVFPRLRNQSADTLCRTLREKYDTSVVPGSFFEMPEHIRIGFACDTEMLKAGLARLAEALRESGDY